jgi:hypothetical protein
VLAVELPEIWIHKTNRHSPDWQVSKRIVDLMRKVDFCCELWFAKSGKLVNAESVKHLGPAMCIRHCKVCEWVSNCVEVSTRFCRSVNTVLSKFVKKCGRVSKDESGFMTDEDLAPVKVGESTVNVN